MTQSWTVHMLSGFAKLKVPHFLTGFFSFEFLYHAKIGYKDGIDILKVSLNFCILDFYLASKIAVKIQIFPVSLSDPR